MAETLSPYDPAEDLSSDAARAHFMAEAIATGDAGYIAHARGVVARAERVGRSERKKNSENKMNL